jgi:hypothetical protein
MTDILLSLGHVWVMTLLLGLLFIAAGGAVYRQAFSPEDDSPPPFRWAASYFLGMYLFFFLFRLIALVLGAAVGCYLALAVLLALAIWQGRMLAPEWRQLLPLLLGLFLLFTMLTIARYFGQIDDFDMHTSLGSLHAGRYANIGIYIVEENQIPRLTQNYGQSLLVAGNLLLRVPGPLAILSAWLSLSHGMFALLLYGLFRRFRLTPIAAGLGTFFVLFCNITLSSDYIYLIDSGSPLGFTGYTDTTAALASWLVFLVWLQQWLVAERAALGTLVVPALLAYGWSFTGPQNIIIGGIVIGVLGLSQAGAFRRQFLLGCVVVLAAGIGSAQGGMLLPASWATQTGLPGIMTMQAAGETGVLPEQAFAFREDGSIHWWFQVYGKDFPRGRFYLESQLWMTLRLLFFPLAGILALSAFGLSSKSDALDARSRSFWAQATIGSLFPGFVACFWFIYPGYKWELTRFLLPGVMTTLPALVIVVHFIGMSVPRTRGWLWAALLICGTPGPLIQWSEGVVGSFLDAGAPPVSARLEKLLMPGPIPAGEPHTPAAPKH